MSRARSERVVGFNKNNNDVATIVGVFQRSEPCSFHFAKFSDEVPRKGRRIHCLDGTEGFCFPRSSVLGLIDEL